MRFLHSLVAVLGLASIALSQGPRETKLTAPTYYIAADADYKGLDNEMRVWGASNLPPGARLLLSVYDPAEQRHTELNQDATTTVNNEGFFDVILRPKPGIKFRHNLVCTVVFMPTYPPQSPSVLRLVGREGQHLGFPKNPQARVASGGYYIEEVIHVP